MGLDPTLLKAGQVDYSWIGNAVKDGTTFAQTKMHLDTQRKSVEAQLLEHRHQKDMVNMQKGMSVFQDVQRAMGETGNVRKAIIEGAKQKAQLFGLPITDDFWEATLSKDPAYEQKINSAMANLQSPDPDTRDAALSTLSGNITSSSWTKLAGISSNTGKQKLEADKAATEASQKNRELDLKESEIGLKGTKTLYDDAAKITKVYEPLLNTPDLAIKLLKQGNASGDQAAMQKFIRSMGNERITVAAVNANTNIGSAIERLDSLTGKYKEGTLFSAPVRLQLIKTLQELKKNSTDEAKSLLDPVVQRSLANGKQRDALLSGQIIPSKMMGSLYPHLPQRMKQQDDLSSEAPAKQRGPALPGNRNALEQQAIKQAIQMGASVKGINAANAKRGLKPMSPDEYNGWKNLFGTAIQPTAPLNQPAPGPQVDTGQQAAPQAPDEGVVPDTEDTEE